MKNSALWIGCIMLTIIIIVMFFGPYLPHVDTTLSESRSRWGLDNRIELPKYAPSSLNLLGSDKTGVDNFSRLILGTKETIMIIVGIALVRYIIGVPLGLLSYRNKGFFHSITTGWNQIFSYLPTFFSAVIILCLPFMLFGSTRLFWVILTLAILEAGRVAYVTQQQANKISKELYIEAAHALGLSPWRIAKSYYMPGLIPEMIVNFCLDLGRAALLVGQLGILGIFLSQDWVETHEFTMEFLNTSNNWINLLADSRFDIYLSKFSFVFFPAGAIMFTILTFNVLGEGLRRHFNRRGYRNI